MGNSGDEFTDQLNWFVLCTSTVSLFILFKHLSIVTRRTGYETLQVSKAKTKVLQFMLTVLRPCTIFCFTFAHYG